MYALIVRTCCCIDDNTCTQTQHTHAHMHAQSFQPTPLRSAAIDDNAASKLASHVACVGRDRSPSSSSASPAAATAAAPGISVHTLVTECFTQRARTQSNPPGVRGIETVNSRHSRRPTGPGVFFLSSLSPSKMPVVSAAIMETPHNRRPDSILNDQSNDVSIQSLAPYGLCVWLFIFFFSCVRYIHEHGFRCRNVLTNTTICARIIRDLRTSTHTHDMRAPITRA